MRQIERSATTRMRLLSAAESCEHGHGVSELSDMVLELATTPMLEIQIDDAVTALACEIAVAIRLAGVAVVTVESTSLRWNVLASSPEWGQPVEFERTLNDGPVSRTMATGDRLVIDSLELDLPRYSTFVQERGAQGTATFPLRNGVECVGVLQVFSRSRLEPLMGPAARNCVQAVADVVGTVVGSVSTYQQTARLLGQTSEALDSRVIVEQAKGVIAERYGIGMNQAFALLRGFARRNRMQLRVAAEAVVEGTAALQASPVQLSAAAILVSGK